MKNRLCDWCESLGRACIWPMRTANFVIGLLFLPKPWRRWLFGTGTRALKVLNVGFLTAWTVMLLDGGYGGLPTYAGFARVPVPWAVVILLAVMALLAWAFIDNSLRGRIIGGTALMLSGLVWTAVSISFFDGYPPLHTGMVVYPLMALLSVLAGDHMRDEARALLALGLPETEYAKEWGEAGE